MHPLLSLCVFWLLPLALMLEENLRLGCVPRKSVPFDGDHAHLFREEGVFNYSIMLLREDLGLLVLGAREALYALDLKDITKKLASVKWEVTEDEKKECKKKGKDSELECKNYIRILHKMTDNRMYVCGTHAFDPVCDYMSYADGNLTLEKKVEDGKGKCPFDPFQRYASIMVDNVLYSATSINFLGSEPVLMGSSPVAIRTEFKSSWLNEPTFVSMAQMPESEKSEDGDDDKIYLFFSETAVECDCYNKLVVSRVARVCKGDLGGQRTLQKKWTSFLKARMDCPVLESQLPFIIQDTYRWCDPQQHWKDCLFYAIFTPQSGTLDLSAVCAYRVSDISRVFAEGKYKTPVPVETSFVKWVMYSGDVPVPRPGACINNEARKMNINRTLDLPDRTLQFIKDRPLMDQAIQPIGQKPLLVRRGATFTSIIVDNVMAADGEKHRVMFIGTAEGTLLKALNHDGEMFIIEEIQLFQPPKPIKILKISNITGQLYAGSDYGAAQVSLATCERSFSCMDCVLARDPYCGWDKVTRKCIVLSSSQRELIQSVKDGNASLCPDSDPVKPKNHSVWQGGNLRLSCPLPSSLAKTSWELENILLKSSARLQLLKDELLIFNASDSDAGLYRCLSVEHSKTKAYKTTVAEYQVRIAQPVSGKGETVLPRSLTDGHYVSSLQAIVVLLVLCLFALLAWNCYKGHLAIPWKCGKKNGEQGQEANEDGGPNTNVSHQDALRTAVVEEKPLVLGTGSSNNNHTTEEATFSAAGENDAPRINLPSLQCVNNESVI
ncbi:Semaphorin-4E Semaphorin-7 Semaphorin-Z7 [Channa argus]|uniref:Semaphorin-1A n=1 Tax=Channa argus TaxID=215402 RepID=A0A6G1QAD3_CHAAH|nr:Semaphorin-4E Semaphorin-7 Semaphorin-Z7 [Channa argus]